eukprot:m.389910 g.389910  ORF g.389910 m.389910 type:complete len:570 (-) comp16753_c0_seq60:175-1884(-)
MPGLNPLAPVFTPRAANVRPPVVDRIANDPAFNVEDVLGGIDVCSSDFEQVSKTQKVLTLACHPGLLPDGAEETPEMRAQVIGDALAVLEAVDYMPNSKTPKGEATTPPGSRPGEGVGTTYIDVTSNPGRVGSLVQQCIATMCGAPSPDISLARLVGFDLKRGPGDPFVGDYASQLHRVILFLNFCDCNREREEGSPHPWVLFLINVESRYLDRPSAAPLEQRIAAQEAATASLRTELRSGINQLTAAQEATNKSARTTAQALGRIEAKLSGPEAIPPGWPPATSGTAYAAAAPSEPRPRPRVEELTSSWGTTPQAIPASAPATDPQPGNRVQSPGFPMDVVDAQVGHPQLTRVHPGDPLESRKVKKNRWIAPDGMSFRHSAQVTTASTPGVNGFLVNKVTQQMLTGEMVDLGSIITDVQTVDGHPKTGATSDHDVVTACHVFGEAVRQQCPRAAGEWDSRFMPQVHRVLPVHGPDLTLRIVQAHLNTFCYALNTDGPAPQLLYDIHLAQWIIQTTPAAARAAKPASKRPARDFSEQCRNAAAGKPCAKTPCPFRHDTAPAVAGPTRQP